MLGSFYKSIKLQAAVISSASCEKITFFGSKRIKRSNERMLSIIFQFIVIVVIKMTDHMQKQLS